MTATRADVQDDARAPADAESRRGRKLIEQPTERAYAQSVPCFPARSPSNGLGFTGANRDAMMQGSRSTVKQRFASGATQS